MVCPHCGANDGATFTRAGLVAHREPYRVNYRGRRLALTPSQAEMLYQLVRFGRRSFETLQIGRSYESMRVTAHAIRSKLPAGIEIRAERGWGYELWVGGEAA